MNRCRMDSKRTRKARERAPSVFEREGGDRTLWTIGKKNRRLFVLALEVQVSASTNDCLVSFHTSITDERNAPFAHNHLPLLTPPSPLSSPSYGFVTFLSESSALSAISTLDKSELSGRQINVELAKPPTSSPAGRIPKAAAKAAVENGTTEGEVVTEGDGEGPKKARKPRAKVSFESLS